MFADLAERSREYKRHQRVYKRQKVYEAADAVYLAVYNKRPQIEIDRLLKRLSDTVTSRKSA